MNPETTYLEHLSSIERIAAFYARKHYLNADECAEFVQVVRVRLFEDNYAIIRKFEGRSVFSTYLNTVIGRIFSQCRVEQWGKWRPSAEAKRLGPTAITLERLLTRDGYTFEEAVKTLTTRSSPHCSAGELEALYLRLPNRTQRPIVLSEDTVPDAVSVESDADDRVESRDRERSARHAVATLDQAIAAMNAEDQVILKMRYVSGRKAPEIAQALGIPQKKIYKRIDKLLDKLRRALAAANLGRPEIEKLLGRPDQEIRLDIFTGGENPPRGPSHPTGEEGRGGEGRLP